MKCSIKTNERSKIGQIEISPRFVHFSCVKIGLDGGEKAEYLINFPVQHLLLGLLPSHTGRLSPCRGFKLQSHTLNIAPLSYLPHMTDTQQEQLIQDLTLALAWLTSFDDNARFKDFPEPALKAWNGYDFEILDQLGAQELIAAKPRHKSFYILPKGEERAKSLVEKLAPLLQA